MRIAVIVALLNVIALFAVTDVCAAPVKSEVTDEGFVADAYHSDESPKKVCVLVLGGSEGGKADYLAQLFADSGFPVLSLAYFKAAGTPDELDMIRLEYFDKPLAWLRHNEKMGGGRVVVFGGSKGAELALLLASKKAEIQGVIAIAPSSVVWQGLPKVFWPPRSSWSANGQGVPYVPYDISKGFNDLLVLYRQSLTNAPAVEKAAIEVEKINGPLLLLSGGADAMWPSNEMAETICGRLKEKKFQHKYEHINYPDAGHTLNEFYMLGGTREGNGRAREDSTKRMLEFVNAIDAGARPTR